jgi:cytidine deaminase
MSDRARRPSCLSYQRDMNPMKPCGACREWLKKIAEVNPSFKVLTFTDQGGAGVYMESEF